MSKHNQVRNHLLSGQTITGLTALDLFQLYRLSSVISRLRDEGLPIETIMIDREDGTQYAKYLIPINKR